MTNDELYSQATAWRLVATKLSEIDPTWFRYGETAQDAAIGFLSAPIDMVIYCPCCGLQHIDNPSEGWDNPPHRSHLCHGCNHVWRPADVPTNGVAAVRTVGKADHPTMRMRAAALRSLQP